MILNICDLPDVLKVMRIVNIVITIIKVVVPIMLIVSAMIDLVRAISDSELNKITKSMVNKVIAAVLVFLIPTFVKVIAGIAGNNSEYEACLGDITHETIIVAYTNQMENLTKKAEESLNISDYNTALSYLYNIENENERNQFEERLKKVKEKIEEAKKPKALEPIKPGSNETIIKQEETESFKVYITKNGSYYITRLWMVEPYTQVNKRDASPYGSTLSRPGDILKSAISSKNLENKLVVGMNASGFYLKDTYDASSVSRYPAFNKTSVGTIVITDGKVVRNAYTKAYKTWFIGGIDKNNTFRIFTDKTANNQSEFDEKKRWADEVINSRIRNTFTFASPLIENGSRSNTSTSFPSASSQLNRQAICQINTNNFALVTGSGLSRDNLINIMLNLKCQTALNLDGGGSIALLFKSKNSNTIETIIGNGRNVTEVVYFTE